MTTITLGSPAVELRVNVQRAADKTLVMRLMNGEENVTADYTASIVMDGVTWTAAVEEVDGSAAHVWRLSEGDTDLEPGPLGARLELAAGEVSTVLAVGEVRVQ